MDLDGVRTFVAVVDGGRFRDAAAVLGVTQQAVSKRIAALETRLGVRLFARGARGPRSRRTGRRSSRTPASCCAPRRAPSTRYGPDAAPCAST